MHLYRRGKEVKGSPFMLDVKEEDVKGEARPKKVKCYGDGKANFTLNVSTTFV